MKEGKKKGMGLNPKKNMGTQPGDTRRKLHGVWCRRSASACRQQIEGRVGLRGFQVSSLKSAPGVDCGVPGAPCCGSLNSTPS